MIKNKIQIIKPLLLILSLFIGTTLIGQNEVDVTKPYEPAIKDAFKISKPPQITDTATNKVTLEYRITPKPFTSFFKPAKIEPAVLKPEVKALLNRGYVRIGIGNYIIPLLDVAAHSLQSKDYQWRVNFKHHSINGKITNRFNKRQFAGYSTNRFSASGKKILPSAVAYANINFKNQKNYYFGHTLDDSTENVKNTEYEKKDMKSLPINTFNAKIGINSTHLDSTHLNYKLYGKFQHTHAKTNIKEDQADLGVDVDYYFNHHFIGTQGNVKYIQNAAIIDTLEHVVINFNPWIGAFGKKWRIQVGVNTTYDQKTAKYHFFPNIKLHYNVASFVMVPYFEYSGKYKLNTYTDIANENHFIEPNLYVKPTILKSIISGGLRGNISSRLGFNFNGTWQKINNQYFYIDAHNNNATQYFNVAYDDIKHLRILTEVSWKKSERFNILIQGTYNQYTLDTLSKAYYMPVYKINTHLMYNIKDKIILTSDIFYKGERYAHDQLRGDIKLKDIFDLNIGGEYLYNEHLSGFVQFSNILAQKRYEWLNYRLLGFQFMIGATYRF